MTERILVIGACGQLGSELTLALRDKFGKSNVVAADINPPTQPDLADGPFEKLNILDAKRLGEVVDAHKITQIYHLAALLSATGEKNPLFAWELNMDGLLYVLELAKEKKLHKVYWPSSIAAFGPNTPRQNTPQHCVMDPNTVYGISKQAGERWCEYYFQKFGVDVRSLRYPGLIGYKTPPGGGTTDYAVDIYYKAVDKVPFTSFLQKGTYLPMMYMPDAIKATIDLMEVEAERVKIRSSYNLSSMSFAPEEVAASIQKVYPDFTISYAPDFRQKIADSWPMSIDDSQARADWGWQHQYDLDAMTHDMIHNLEKMKASV
ncbi:L-threonine 3-dehydrogenase [Cytophagales bacterium LB-30]|uniref:L-threonine 3-dehydrogenase n=1 Tax=Shiella aurantiaca TaxID=3058365 RepID=A0ABT8F364_9BACT|nr:L-threonine 3-dehydrogenase [Shiella aurantiaca]MDN4164679.1 L-threonine 3-dehydrogenase [Shiella aurantiaca]